MNPTPTMIKTNTAATITDRPLSQLDSLWYETGLGVLNSVWKFPGTKKLGSKKKQRAAFRRMIRCSPQLQKVVVTDEDGRHTFRQSTAIVEGSFVILDRFECDKEAKENIRSLVFKQVLEYRTDKELRSSCPLKLAVAQGPKDCFIAVVAPHHFMDGVAIGSSLLKFVIYTRLPKAAWCLLNRLEQESGMLPSMDELALKDQYDIKKQVDRSLDKITDPTNQRYLDYDPLVQLDMSKLFVYQKIVGSTTNVCKQSRDALKGKGITISSVIQSLSLKVMAKVFECSPEKCIPGPICGNTGIDARKLGRWGDSRDLKCNRFPEIANLTLGVSSQIPAESALKNSIEEIAVVVKSDFTRVQLDVEFRRHALGAPSSPLLPGGVWCGSSSLRMPESFAKLLRLVRIPAVEIGYVPQITPVPTIWFSIFSAGKTTTVTATVIVPDLSLSDDIVDKVIKQSIAGSAIEPLFNML
jgi:hypothetical protein